MITITLENSGGELDRRQAQTALDAVRMAIELIESAGELYDGDKILIKGDVEDEGR